jgi:magnesium-transporting ATPase (P-type)
MIDPPRNRSKMSFSILIQAESSHVTGTTNSQQKPLQRLGINHPQADVISGGTKWRYQKEVSDIVEHVRVYAISTRQKLKLTARQIVCSMTDDVVNDAPALKSANIGLLGINGTANQRGGHFYLMIIFLLF